VASRKNGRTPAESIPPLPFDVKDVLTGWEYITPAAAVVILAEHNTHNRKLKKSWIPQLAEMIRTGDFMTTHQGIAFCKSGWLLDGQNRLYAIIEANIGVWLMVTRGLPDECMEAIDRGKIRSFPDLLMDIKVDVDINSRSVAIARAIISLGSDSTVPTTRRFIEAHPDALRFVAAYQSKQIVGRAHVLAVVVRAWFTQDHARLTAFMECLDTGVTTDPDADLAAITLRDYLMSGRVRANASRPMKREIYTKTETALCAFLDHQPLKRLPETKTELFPLPEDK
jgi:hypothetical protein